MKIDRESQQLLHDEQGLSTVEYIIILILIAVIGIAAWQSFGSTVSSKVSSATGDIGGL